MPSQENQWLISNSEVQGVAAVFAAQIGCSSESPAFAAESVADSTSTTPWCRDSRERRVRFQAKAIAYDSSMISPCNSALATWLCSVIPLYNPNTAYGERQTGQV